MKHYQSWGRYPPATHQVLNIDSPCASLPLPAGGERVLAFGLGRSYGDSCLNDGEYLIDTGGLQNFISFDETTGILRTEAGVSLATFLATFVPRGWFLPTSPGTKFVTFGGAVANDIHGKNHHRAGTFGCHVKALGLLRSNGERLICSATENGDLFKATIAGLGLTGLITWVDVQLARIPGPYLHTRTTKFRNLDEFFDVSAHNDEIFEHNVAWIDCSMEGAAMGRGLFMAGNFTEQRAVSKPRNLSVSFPLDAPNWLLNPLTIKAFNAAYFNKQQMREKEALTHYEPFFYPLDSVHNWNRMYGKRGFFQYQFVVPFENDRRVIADIMRFITGTKRASFLAVIKTFGGIESPGMLSFPRKGVTVALDFANEGAPTLKLMEELDHIVLSAGGALYPAKDARMSPAMFEHSFPRLAEFEKFIDPRFSSSFWRRVRGGV